MLFSFFFFGCVVELCWIFLIHKKVRNVDISSWFPPTHQYLSQVLDILPCASVSALICLCFPCRSAVCVRHHSGGRLQHRRVSEGVHSEVSQEAPRLPHLAHVHLLLPRYNSLPPHPFPPTIFSSDWFSSQLELPSNLIFASIFIFFASFCWSSSS